MRNLIFLILLSFSSVVYSDCSSQQSALDSCRSQPSKPKYGSCFYMGGPFTCTLYGTDDWASNVPSSDIHSVVPPDCSSQQSAFDACNAAPKTCNDGSPAPNNDPAQCPITPPPPPTDCPAGQHRSTATIGETIGQCLSNDPPHICLDNEYWKVSENRCVSFNDEVRACSDTSLTYCPISSSCIPSNIPCTDDPTKKPPVRCADGSFKPEGQCDISLCLDGSIKLSGGSCPPTVTCGDGSIKQFDTGCPKLLVCSDGSLRSSCPVDKPVDDAATKALNEQQKAIDDARKAADTARKAADTAKAQAEQVIQSARDALTQANSNRNTAVNNYNSNPTPENLAVKTAAESAVDAAKTALDGAKSDSKTASDDANTAALDKNTAANDANTAALDALKEGLKGGKGTTPKGINKGTGTTDTTQGSFDDSLDTRLTKAKADFQAKFSDIKQQFNNLVKVNLTGGGGLPSFSYGNIRGQEIIVDFNKWAVQLSPLSSIIYFIMVLAAAFIVLGL